MTYLVAAWILNIIVPICMLVPKLVNDSSFTNHMIVKRRSVIIPWIVAQKHIHRLWNLTCKWSSWPLAKFGMWIELVLCSPQGVIKQLDKALSRSTTCNWSRKSLFTTIQLRPCLDFVWFFETYTANWCKDADHIFLWGNFKWWVLINGTF